MTARSDRAARAEQRSVLATARERAGRNRGRARFFRRLRRALGKPLLDWFAAPLVGLLARTWKVEFRGAGLPAMQDHTAKVLMLWHGTLLAAMPLPGHRRRGFQVLVSPSADGALVVTSLLRFGYQVIRGSSSRGGAQALRALATALRDGDSIVLTPDGPRGPIHTVNSGVGWLARASGAAVITVAVHADRAWRLRSWDRFLIPKPFARVTLTYGAPAQLQKGANAEAIEAFGQQLGQQLLRDGVGPGPA